MAQLKIAGGADGKTTRQRMRELLLQNDQDLRSLSQQLSLAEKEVLDHLHHLELSVRKRNQKLVILPSYCLKCGFSFTKRKRFSKPGRCPRCRSTYIEPPVFRIR